MTIKITAHIQSGAGLVPQTVYSPDTEEEFLRKLGEMSPVGNEVFRNFRAGKGWENTIAIPINKVALWVVEPA